MSSKYQVKSTSKFRKLKTIIKNENCTWKVKKLEKYFYKFIFQVIDGAFKCWVITMII